MITTFKNGLIRDIVNCWKWNNHNSWVYTNHLIHYKLVNMLPKKDKNDDLSLLTKNDSSGLLRGSFYILKYNYHQAGEVISLILNDLWMFEVINYT